MDAKIATKPWILGAVFIAAAAFVCLAAMAPEGKEVVRIGYQPLTVNLPLYIAVEKGYFESEGISVELVKFETTNQVTDALLTGKIDATGIVALHPLLAVEAQDPGKLKVFALNQQTETKHIDAFIVRNDSVISGVEDLKGKKVGVFPGSSTRAIVEVILSKYMEPDEATIMELPTSSQLGALESGQVDALITLEPVPTIAVSTGLARVVEDDPMGRHVVEDFALGAAAVSQKFLAERPGAAAKVAKAFGHGIDAMNADPSLRAVLTKYTSVDGTIAAKVGIGNVVRTADANMSAVQALADIYFEKGQLPKHVEVTGMLAR